MWTEYSTRDASEFVGLSESAIRSCVRAGLLTRDTSRLRFSFRDLLVLKLVKSLVAGGVTLRRARRQLAELRARVPREASLASITISARGGHVVVQESGYAYRADSGQLYLNLGDVEAAATGELTALPTRPHAPGPELDVQCSAEDWFERGLDLEQDDPAAAIHAYRRSLDLRPGHPDALINLGRLHAELGDIADADRCFRGALESRPDDPTAIYNLGVVAQDRGSDAEAIEHYRRALELDPGLAEAHYNLATIFDRTGKAQEAIRHINEYRKLTRQRS